MSAEKAREAARKLIGTVPGMMQAVASEMRHCDAPMTMPHFRALMMLAHHGSFTATELAQRQRVSLPTMSATVSVLVDRGWVERVIDESDRRRSEVRLTDEGKAAVRAMYGRVQDMLTDRLGELDDDELDRVQDALVLLQAAFGGHKLPAEIGEDA